MIFVSFSEAIFVLRRELINLILVILLEHFDSLSMLTL